MFKSKHVLFALSLISIFALAAIFVHLYIAGATKNRINKTIEMLEKHAPGCAAISVLERASVKSLKKPVVIFANVCEQKKTVVLLVQWVELSPTPTSIGIMMETENVWSFYQIDNWCIQENRETFDRGIIIFIASIGFEPKGNEWNRIAQPIRESNCSIGLFAKGKLISNIVPIRYIAGPMLKQ